VGIFVRQFHTVSSCLSNLVLTAHFVTSHSGWNLLSSPVHSWRYTLVHSNISLGRKLAIGLVIMRKNGVAFGDGCNGDLPAGDWG
jgi:hypothetical protein